MGTKVPQWTRLFLAGVCLDMVLADVGTEVSQLLVYAETAVRWEPKCPSWCVFVQLVFVWVWCWLWFTGMMPDSPTSLGRKGHDRCCLARTSLILLSLHTCGMCAMLRRSYSYQGFCLRTWSYKCYNGHKTFHMVALLRWFPTYGHRIDYPIALFKWFTTYGHRIEYLIALFRCFTTYG